MGRYYRRRSYSHGSEAARAHVAAYRALEQRLGPIIEDIKKLFFGLDEHNRSLLLDEYEEGYGKKARDYAQKTIADWKAETRKMSGQTAERLLNIVPRYILSENRFELVKKLHNHFLQKTFHEVSINIEYPSAGLNELNEIVKDIVNRKTGDLPEHVTETILWLNDSDVKASKLMLEALDKEINKNSKSYAEKELRNIYALVSREEKINLKYTMDFVNASICIDFVRPKKGLLKRIFG